MINCGYKNILVIGGDGFLGSYLVEQLSELSDCRVTVLDRFPCGKIKNLSGVRNRIELVSGDYKNSTDLERSMEGKQLVFNFACASNPSSSWADPFIELEGNIAPALRLLEMAGQCGVEKIVFPSSGGTVYGPACNPVSETAPVHPSSPYGIGKLCVELFLQYAAEKYELKYDIYRIANAYGPRQPVGAGLGVIGVWMHRILNSQPLFVYGDDSVKRDYIHAADVAVLMLHSLSTDGAGIYNLGTGRGVSIMQMLDVFKQTIDIPFEYHVRPKRASDNSSIVLDSSKILQGYTGFTFRNLENELPAVWDNAKRRWSG